MSNDIVSYEFVNGNLIRSSEVNTNFDDVVENTPQLNALYTGTGFDSYQVSTGTDEQSYEFASIAASKLVGKTYLQVEITAEARAQALGTGGEYGIASIKVQTKDIGGSYTDSLAYVIFFQSTNPGGDDNYNRSAHTYNYYHTLTNDEKTNGIQVKVFSKCDAADSASCYAEFLNNGTVLRLI